MSRFLKVKKLSSADNWESLRLLNSSVSKNLNETSYFSSGKQYGVVKIDGSKGLLHSRKMMLPIAMDSGPRRRNEEYKSIYFGIGSD